MSRADHDREPDVSDEHDSDSGRPLVRSETRSVARENREWIETQYYLARRGWAVILTMLAVQLLVAIALVIVAMYAPEMIDAVDALARSMDSIGGVINS